jgi:hypothetical protein
LKLITEDEAEFSIKRMSFYDNMGVLSGRISEKMLGKLIGGRYLVEKTLMGFPDLTLSQSMNSGALKADKPFMQGKPKDEKPQWKGKGSKKAELRELMGGKPS